MTHFLLYLYCTLNPEFMFCQGIRSCHGFQTVCLIYDHMLIDSLVWKHGIEKSQESNAVHWLKQFFFFLIANETIAYICLFSSHASLIHLNESSPCTPPQTWFLPVHATSSTPPPSTPTTRCTWLKWTSTGLTMTTRWLCTPMPSTQWSTTKQELS